MDSKNNSVPSRNLRKKRSSSVIGRLTRNVSRAQNQHPAPQLHQEEAGGAEPGLRDAAGVRADEPAEQEPEPAAEHEREVQVPGQAQADSQGDAEPEPLPAEQFAAGRGLPRAGVEGGGLQQEREPHEHRPGGAPQQPPARVVQPGQAGQPAQVRHVHQRALERAQNGAGEPAAEHIAQRRVQSVLHSAHVPAEGQHQQVRRQQDGRNVADGLELDRQRGTSTQR